MLRRSIRARALNAYVLETPELAPLAMAKASDARWLFFPPLPSKVFRSPSRKHVLHREGVLHGVLHTFSIIRADV